MVSVTNTSLFPSELFDGISNSILTDTNAQLAQSALQESSVTTEQPNWMHNPPEQPGRYRNIQVEWNLKMGRIIPVGNAHWAWYLVNISYQLPYTRDEIQWTNECIGAW